MFTILIILFTFASEQTIIHPRKKINDRSDLEWFQEAESCKMRTGRCQKATLITVPRIILTPFITSVFLAMSGGFQDAYTYFTRDEVFSNAQTGNVVLMSHNFMTGQWGDGLRYLFPVLAFAIGVVAAERIQNTFKYAKKLHWRQMILLIEILILFAVGFMPGELDMLATVLVSFSCAMQVQTFRKVGGYSYASTMCIGNLRSGTAALSVYCREKRPEQLKQALYYFGIIFFFAIGAGGNLSMRLGIPAIWVSDVLLLISFILMFSSKHRD